jgi:SagB-type dehydrogenase family enzyme
MENILLPEPIRSGGKALLDALNERCSSREFAPLPLNDQQLSDLLWAAFGINRSESGMRTAPSALNIREMKLYAVMPQGTYVYDPALNCLNPVTAGDLRKRSAQQPELRAAPLHIALVADYSKYNNANEATKQRFTLLSHAHAGFIGQNIYLYCASAGLSTCFVTRFNHTALAKALGLVEDQLLLYTQVVGYPTD